MWIELSIFFAQLVQSHSLPFLFFLFQISYCLDDGSGEIFLTDLSKNVIMAVLTANTACYMLSVKGVWLAAAQEQSADEVFVSYVVM